MRKCRFGDILCTENLNFINYRFRWSSVIFDSIFLYYVRARVCAFRGQLDFQSHTVCHRIKRNTVRACSERNKVLYNRIDVCCMYWKVVAIVRTRQSIEHEWTTEKVEIAFIGASLGLITNAESTNDPVDCNELLVSVFLRCRPHGICKKKDIYDTCTKCNIISSSSSSILSASTRNVGPIYIAQKLTYTWILHSSGVATGAFLV